MGGKKLGEQLEQQLKAQGRKPYVIPVGGSDSIGTFGYLAATQEILDQAGKEAFTDIINVSPLPWRSLIGHHIAGNVIRLVTRCSHSILKPN